LAYGTLLLFKKKTRKDNLFNINIFQNNVYLDLPKGSYIPCSTRIQTWSRTCTSMEQTTWEQTRKLW